jgi:hypothetical protein
MQVIAHTQKSTMGIDDLSLGGDLNLFASFGFRQHGDANTKYYAFATAAIGLFLHLGCP